MLLLLIYVFIALGFSFLCSIAEAVLLSVTVGYIAVQEQENHASAKLMRTLKEDINKPLAAILTLNTIAHTVGAAGAGAQASIVFGSAYFGIISAILTLLILIFSEIIPKTLGAHYWQKLAPSTAYAVSGLVWLLYPFVKLSELLTSSLTHGPGLKGFNRDEFSAMAQLSWEDGLLDQQELKILMNLLSMKEIKVEQAMTPHSVVFSVQSSMSVSDYCQEHQSERFSRIPIYEDDVNLITGFVLLNDVLLAQTRGDGTNPIAEYKRELIAVLDTFPLSKAFNQLLHQRANILLVVNEYGHVKGIVTLEDILETILGLELVDEGDKSRDMQELARRFWRRKARKKGLDIKSETPEN
ncbi:MAG: DUF21 domain-containing protein [Gammaproteobacteria bacterium]|nr:DUF21 domain-containing protein [Gammaproteobacteria bacterium]